MTDHVLDWLDDFVDGELDDASARRVQAHLGVCAECAAAEQRLRALLAAAGALPAIEPPADVWQNVQARTTGARPSRRAVLWSYRYQLAAAAVVLMLLSSALTMAVLRRSTPAAPEPNSVATLVAVANAEQDYARVARDLESALNRRTSLDSATIRIVRENLLVMDRAIAEARKALEKSPNNAELTRLVSTTYRRKINLLERTLRLSANL